MAGTGAGCGCLHSLAQPPSQAEAQLATSGSRDAARGCLRHRAGRSSLALAADESINAIPHAVVLTALAVVAAVVQRNS